MAVWSAESKKIKQKDTEHIRYIPSKYERIGSIMIMMPVSEFAVGANIT